MGTKTLDVFFWHWIVFIVLNHYFNITDLFLKDTVGKVIYLFIAFVVSIVLAQGHFISLPLNKIKKIIFNLETEK